MALRTWSRWSIEWKLPVLLGGVLLAVIVALSTAAYLEAVRSARAVAGGRLASVAQQGASSLDSTALQLVTRADTAAASPALQAYLRSPSRRNAPAAMGAIQYPGPQPQKVASVALWDTEGRQLLAGGPDAARVDTAFVRRLLPNAGRRESAWVDSFRVVNDTLIYPTLAPISEGGSRLGYLVQWRYMVTPPESLAKTLGLIGSEAALYVGNGPGGKWTDLTRSVPPPPVDPRPERLLDYQRPGAGGRLAAAAATRFAPWIVLIEFPRAIVLAPAQQFLRRLVVIAALFFVSGLGLAWAVSRRITQPIRALTEASEAMRSTSYQTPLVPVNRKDELGRLAEAFNRAVESVRQVQSGLEYTVAERTRELQESESRLHQILDSLPVAVYVVDQQGHPQFANRLSQEILGRGIVPNASVEDLARVYQAYRTGTGEPYPGDQQPIVFALQGQRAHAADFEIRRPDKAVRIEVWAAPVYDRDGNLASAVAAFTDITDRERGRAEIERLNHELARRITELEAVNAELDTFCYSVSHDLRAPLRAIDGFSRMLLDDYGSTLHGEARRLLGVVRASTSGMGQLIDDLLTFSRLSRKALETGLVDMTALARAAVEDCRAAAANDSARVVVDGLPAVRGDGPLLRQAWANLVGNALKFSRQAAQPLVEIGARNADGEVVFFVRDNGVGFDMEYAGKLFGVFQRLHRADEFEGTGVGLALVQRVVHRHGGRVWAEAAPGKGATFYFSLPADEG